MRTDPNIDELSETAEAKTKGFLEHGIDLGVILSQENQPEDKKFTEEQLAKQKEKRLENIKSQIANPEAGDILLTHQATDWGTVLAPVKLGFAGAMAFLSSNGRILDRMALELDGVKRFGRLIRGGSVSSTMAFSSKSEQPEEQNELPETTLAANSLDKAQDAFQKEFPEAASGAVTANLDIAPALDIKLQS